MEPLNHHCTDMCARACDTCGEPLCLDATDFDDPGLAHPGGEAAEALGAAGAGAPGAVEWLCSGCVAESELNQSRAVGAALKGTTMAKITFRTMTEGALALARSFQFGGAPVWTRDELVDYFYSLAREIGALEAYAIELRDTALCDQAAQAMDDNERAAKRIALLESQLEAETARARYAEGRLAQLTLSRDPKGPSFTGGAK